MYVVVDQRTDVVEGYTASFNREGFAAMGFGSDEFQDWLNTADENDLTAIESFVLGDFSGREAVPETIRHHSRAPIIALSEVRSLDLTLDLFAAGADDVVRKPVHVREIVARSNAIARRATEKPTTAGTERLKVFFNGRDPEIDGEAMPLPRRERHILEYLVKNAHRRVTKTQIFNAIYGIFDAEIDEIVVEGHISKLRKKLRLRIGHDVIDAKRYLGYQFVG